MSAVPTARVQRVRTAANRIFAVWRATGLCPAGISRAGTTAKLWAVRPASSGISSVRTARTQLSATGRLSARASPRGIGASTFRSVAIKLSRPSTGIPSLKQHQPLSCQVLANTVSCHSLLKRFHFIETIETDAVLRVSSCMHLAPQGEATKDPKIRFESEPSSQLT
jgi:hypothetical protein